ncbi:hypothetical protein SHIRM173S_03749 [Streptomyces hirsutus]
MRGPCRSRDAARRTGTPTRRCPRTASTSPSPRTSPGGVGGPSRILVADAATGAITGQITPPAGEQTGGDAQPTWSSDGTTLAFTRNEVIDGNKHIWTVSSDHLDQQDDLSAKICPGDCEVIDDSPAFSPDGTTIAFNRKSGGGQVDQGGGILLTSLKGDDCLVLTPAADLGLPVALDAGGTGLDAPAAADVWSALGGELKASLQVRVRAPLAGVTREAAPPVTEGLVVRSAARSEGGEAMPGRRLRYKEATDPGPDGGFAGPRERGPAPARRRRRGDRQP